MNIDVLAYEYNGFMGTLTGGKTDYTAKPVAWCIDPGVVICECSDGVVRYIPAYALLAEFEYPEFDKSKIVMFGPTADIEGVDPKFVYRKFEEKDIISIGHPTRETPWQ